MRLDRFSSADRSRIMGLVRSTDTGPEITLRKILHSMGFRFSLHRSDLPGKPDLVLPKWKVVLFVNGCFWHQHSGCLRAVRPQSNVAFWNRKLDRNVARDRENIRSLRAAGWRVKTVWECQVKDSTVFRRNLDQFIRKAHL
jgi:DNA mismatch endonuclease, patch repair protein